MNQKTDDTGNSSRGSENAEVPASEDAERELLAEGAEGSEAADTSSSESDDETTAPEPGKAPAEPARVERQAGRRGGIVSVLVAWLALLIAVGSAGGVLYLIGQAGDDEARATEIAALQSALADLSDGSNRMRTELQDVERRLDQAGEQNTRTSRTAESLERDLRELARQGESVAPRIANLENALSALQGVSAGVRDTWLLAEAEYFMQIANAQLQLAGNPDIAALALTFANERVRELADPALGEVRRTLTEELQALDAMEKPDIEGMTLALASLADRVDALPLDEHVATPGKDEAAIDPELGGFARAVASVRRAFSDAVSVRRVDEAVTPLMSPDAAYFLRTNLALQLQTARLALLQGEHEVFQQSLADAAAWIEQYYDADNRAVAGALRTISELKDDRVLAAPPDISGSLRLLRRYRTLRDANGSGGNISSNEAEAPEGSDESGP